MRRMRRILAALAATAAAVATTVFASPPIPCADAPDGETCVPVYACVRPTETGGAEVFVGRAIGVDAGRLDGALSGGADCVGQWRRLPDGRGVVEGACDDGRGFEIEYGYRDPATGTAVGRGFTDRGEPVMGWSGLEVRRFFEQRLYRPDGSLPCGEASTPVS